MPWQPPATVGYFCSTLATTGPGAGADATGRTRAEAISFLERHSRHFWPNAVDPATGGFRWDFLCADTDARGPDRFDTQYWTANTDPSDRYVPALPGHRHLPAAARPERLRQSGPGR